MKTIIEKAYQVFGEYKAKRPLDICTDCCMDLKDEELLSKLQVSEIPQHLLREYTNGAATAKTPITEVKHFLPRMLELTSQFDFPTHSTELTFKRFEPFNPQEWSEPELDLLSKFALSFFKRCLSQYPFPSNDSIDSILIMFQHRQFDIAPLLVQWKSTQTLPSLLHFKDLYNDGFKYKKTSKMVSGFANERISVLLRDWLDNKEVRQAFKNSIEKQIMNNVEIDSYQLNDINILYEVL